jgi:hypothetical protein
MKAGHSAIPAISVYRPGFSEQISSTTFAWTREDESCLNLPEPIRHAVRKFRGGGLSLLPLSVTLRRHLCDLPEMQRVGGVR